MDPQKYAEDLGVVANQMYEGGLTLNEAMKRFRCKFILAALVYHEGNQCAAAKEIGIHRNTLHREAKLCGISRKRRA